MEPHQERLSALAVFLLNQDLGPLPQILEIMNGEEQGRHSGERRNPGPTKGGVNPLPSLGIKDSDFMLSAWLGAGGD